MEDSIKKEIQRLKDEMLRRKAALDDIKKLVQRDIDRQFETDAQDLSEREMETFIRENLLPIKKNIDIHPDGSILTSHRKILGKPILRLKRAYMKMIDFYTSLFADKQTKFNEHSFALLQAALLRSRRNQESLRQIEERITQCEERLVIIMHKLEDMYQSLERQKGKAEKSNPTTK